MNLGIPASSTSSSGVVLERVRATMSFPTLFLGSSGTRSADPILRVGFWTTLSTLAVLALMVLTLGAVEDDGE